MTNPHNESTPFQKFEALARHILTTPKAEAVKGKSKAKPRAKKSK
jgi:hypothetical protein